MLPPQTKRPPLAVTPLALPTTTSVSASPRAPCQFKPGQNLVLDAPPHSGLPRRGTVTVLRVNENQRTYDVVFVGAGFSGARTARGVSEAFLRRPEVLVHSKSCRDMEVGNLFQKFVFDVPFFQRKYCWGITQWHALWKDVLATNQVAGTRSHSLGRVMLRQHVDQNTQSKAGTTNQAPETTSEALGLDAQRTTVCDGQQRITTLVVLISAIRDSVLACSNETVCPACVRTAVELRERCNYLLFPASLSVSSSSSTTPPQMSATTTTSSSSSSSSAPFSTNEDKITNTLRRCVLVPTWDDREPFVNAVSTHQLNDPPCEQCTRIFLEYDAKQLRSPRFVSNNNTNNRNSGHQAEEFSPLDALPPPGCSVCSTIAQTKSFFLDRATTLIQSSPCGASPHSPGNHGVSHVSSVLHTILTSFRVVSFEIETDNATTQQTNASSSQMLYENLAVRENALGKVLRNFRPGVGIAEADFVRNFVFGHFPDPQQLAHVQETLWLPFERACGGNAQGIDMFLTMFLESRLPPPPPPQQTTSSDTKNTKTKPTTTDDEEPPDTTEDERPLYSKFLWWMGREGKRLKQAQKSVNDIPSDQVMIHALRDMLATAQNEGKDWARLTPRQMHPNRLAAQQQDPLSSTVPGRNSEQSYSSCGQPNKPLEKLASTFGWPALP